MDTKSKPKTIEGQTAEAVALPPSCSALVIGSVWVPKQGGLPWKLTDIFHSEMGRTAVQIEKYQGGRNSPAIMTTKRLKARFKPNADVEAPKQKR
jgi:hypothetical protein